MQPEIVIMLSSSYSRQILEIKHNKNLITARETRSMPVFSSGINLISNGQRFLTFWTANSVWGLNRHDYFCKKGLFEI